MMRRTRSASKTAPRALARALADADP